MCSSDLATRAAARRTARAARRARRRRGPRGGRCWQRGEGRRQGARGSRGRAQWASPAQWTTHVIGHRHQCSQVATVPAARGARVTPSGKGAVCGRLSQTPKPSSTTRKTSLTRVAALRTIGSRRRLATACMAVFNTCKHCGTVTVHHTAGKEAANQEHLGPTRLQHSAAQQPRLHLEPG